VSRRLIVSAALTLLSAGSAFAATPLVATLATATEKDKPILASIIWECEGTTCTSAPGQKGSPSTACRAIAKRFGKVVAFTSKKGEFDEAQLAQCNKGVTK
jgi:hypothetical protein